jgi:hypothetical protein
LSISYRALLYKIRDAGLPSNHARRRQEEAMSAAAAAPPTDSGFAAD